MPPSDGAPSTGVPRLSPAAAAAIFFFFTAWFYLLLFTLRPLLKANYAWHPALYWFVTGGFLFAPLLMFALWRAVAEGNRGMREILAALHLKPFSGSDWRCSLIGLLAVLLLTGGGFGAAWLVCRHFGWAMPSTTPWFMEMRPLVGAGRLLLLAWLPMFLLNIVGEELLWRGYVQGRLRARGAWLLCSGLWLVFHLPFGPGVMLMGLPAILVIPYVFHKTRNTLAGIFIHGLFNGPAFVAIALGLID